MVNISNYEKRFRKKKKAIFEVVGIKLDWDEIQSMAWNPNEMESRFKANWDGTVWECYYSGAYVGFDDTTINKVKQNISKFFRADPVVKSYRKITVKYY